MTTVPTLCFSLGSFPYPRNSQLGSVARGEYGGQMSLRFLSALVGLHPDPTGTLNN